VFLSSTMPLLKLGVSLIHDARFYVHVSSTMPIFEVDVCLIHITRVMVDVSSTLLIVSSISHPRGQFFEL
jgi:hypothetical protein